MTVFFQYQLVETIVKKFLSAVITKDSLVTPEKNMRTCKYGEKQKAIWIMDWGDLPHLPFPR